MSMKTAERSAKRSRRLSNSFSSIASLTQRGARASSLFSSISSPSQALCRDRQRPVGVFVQRVDEKHLIGELGSRGKQRSQCARGGEFVRTAEIGDDGLAHGTIDALVLDNLNISASSRTS